MLWKMQEPNIYLSYSDIPRISDICKQILTLFLFPNGKKSAIL